MAKNKVLKNSSDSATPTEKQMPLTREELYNVLSFADNYYKVSNSTDFVGAYTPYLTNQRLSQIGLMAREATQGSLTKALKSPIDNQKELIGYSEYVTFKDSIAKRANQYIGNLPTFDSFITCINYIDKSELMGREYLEDLARVREFYNRFDFKSQFSYINRRTVTNDAYYGVFRTDSQNFAFQELPYTNCLITGKNIDWGYVFDFDMQWFLYQGLSLDQYPPNFKKIWRRVFGGKNYLTDYDPSNALTERNGVFGLWSQTSPLPRDGNFVCFKFNSDIYATIPFLTVLFNDSLNKDLVRSLQTDQYIIASQKILVGLIPLLKEQKSGQIKDALAVAPETMGKFLGLLKQGLSDNIKISGVPFSDVKDVSFTPTNKNMYDESNINMGSNSGVTSRFVYASDKLSASEVKYNAMIDEMIATQVYPQYSTWISTMINTLTKKYKFKVTFSGTQFDKKDRLEVAEKLSNRGMFIDQLYSNAIGKNVFELQDLMVMSNTSDFYELLRLPPNSNTASLGGDTKGGRENKGVDDVSDERARSDDYEGD